MYIYIYTYIFQIIFHYRLLEDIEYSSLCYIVVPCLLSFSVSVQFSHAVTTDSLQPHGQKHARLPCPSPTPGTCPNSCPWIMPFNHLILCRPLLLLPSIFPSIRVIPGSLSFASGCQSIGVLASASVLPMNI